MHPKRPGESMQGASERQYGGEADEEKWLAQNQIKKLGEKAGQEGGRVGVDTGGQEARQEAREEGGQKTGRMSHC